VIETAKKHLTAETAEKAMCFLMTGRRRFALRHPCPWGGGKAYSAGSVKQSCKTLLNAYLVASGCLKTWAAGTYHGVEPKDLQSYLDEFVFGFNRRNTPMAAFQTLLDISTQNGPLPLRQSRQPESTR
jgi:hypothetical protein